MLRCRFTVQDMYFHVNGKSILKAALIANDVYGMIMNVWSSRCSSFEKEMS
jgi:hypothetical protein